MDAVKLIVVFLLIVIALRRKLSVGLTLLGAGIITALLYQLPISVLLNGYWELVQSRPFIFLTTVVILITILGSLLKELTFLEKLAASCRSLKGGNRTAVSILPGMIGLMPMPGGALLSAPLVDNVLQDGDYPADLKLVTNYWFRHIFEFFWPVYAGIILTEAITGLPIYKVSLLQFPLTILMATIGLFFFVRRISRGGRGGESTGKALLGIVRSIWPIVLAITIYGLTKIDLTWAVLISLVALIVVARPSVQAITLSLKKGFSPNLILLVFGILSFQMVVELVGAVESITKLATSYHLPEELIIFIVCFTIGILTGMVSAYVGLGYTLLAGFLYQPEIVPSNIFFAYLSGFVGIMLSPSHVCLILTIDYFKTDLMMVYRRLAVPMLLLVGFAYLIYLSPWGQLFTYTGR